MNITKQHDSPMIGVGEGFQTADKKKKKKKVWLVSRVDTCLQSNVSSGVSTEQKPDQKNKKSNATRVKGSLIY